MTALASSRVRLPNMACSEKTLIFYIGDNGAPLKIHKADMPGGGPGWDGSLNDPLNGEKGMLSEGGMHVPFVVSWPGTIPGDQIYEHPISALDVAATATAIASIETKPGDLDGVNLIPYLTGQTDAAPHDALMWRWVSQSAIREGNWKLLRGGDREYLYDLNADLEEKNNLASKYPAIATRLREKMTAWSNTLSPPGLATGPMASTWHDYFDFYLDGKPATPLREKFVTNASAKGSAVTEPLRGWIARNGELTAKDGTLRLTSDKKSKAPFLVRSGLKMRRSDHRHTPSQVKQPWRRRDCVADNEGQGFPSRESRRVFHREQRRVANRPDRVTRK